MRIDVPIADALSAEKRRRSLLAYVRAYKPGYQAGWFHAELCNKLEKWAADCVAGKSPRLMVFAPPRHGKSELCSRALPAWILGRNPERELIMASYGQSLANDMSRDARAYAGSDVHRATFPRFQIGDRDAVEQWETAEGGGVKAVGVGGPITGTGGDLIIDDPTKGAAESLSAVVQATNSRWYSTDARTRVPPGGGVLLVMTRWTMGDLGGVLQELAKRDPAADKWEVACYPAIATDDEPHRKKGEALHPSRWPLEALAALRAGMTAHEWSALFQQNPVPQEGGLIKPAYLSHTYRPTPWVGNRPIDRVSASSPLLMVPGIARGALRIVSADTASKAGELNDNTAIGSAVEIGHTVCLADVTARKLEFPELCDLMQQICERDDPNVVLIEDKSSGTQLIQQLPKRKGWRWSIVAIEPVNDKVTRMNAETPWLEAGRLLVPENGPWRPEFDRELLEFPHGKKDRADMLSQLLAYLRIRSASSLRNLYSA